MKRRLLIGVARFLIHNTCWRARVMLQAYGQDRRDPAVLRPVRRYRSQLDNGIKLYMQQHGDTVAGKKIEIIRKDVGGIAPEVAKRLAQELVVRDNVDILAGFALTPNALAAADVSAEAKKFMVVMNAATSIITTKSPYMARTSVTTPQIDEMFGTWAAKHGIKTVYTMVSDYGPGIDAEAAFHTRLQGGGRPDRRIGSVAGGQSGFLRLRAARQGRQSGRDLHLRSRRRAAGGGGKALAERGIDAARPKSWARARSPSRARSRAWATRDRHHHRVPLRLHHNSALNQQFVTAYNEDFRPQAGHLLDRRL